MAVRAQRVFKTGVVLRVLPHVDSRSKTIDRTRCMSYEKFVKSLRAVLLHIFAPGARACKYAGPSMRSGGATPAAIGKLSPLEIGQLAGVKDFNWLMGYERNG